MNGCFQIARKSFESEIWTSKPAEWWKLWCFILGSVQHKDFKELKRGQGYFNFKEILRLGLLGKPNRGEPIITYFVIDHALRYMVSAKMIAKKQATWGTLITVLKYDQYQKIDNYQSEPLGEPKSESVGEVEAKWKRSGSENINKNDKNDKNVYRPDKKEFSLWVESLKVDPEFKGKNIDLELKKFKDWILASGKKYSDYKAGFRNWLRNSDRYLPYRKVEVKGDNERMLEKLNATRN